MQQVLNQRLTLSEAIELVGKMLRGYPNKERTDQGYTGAMAEILMYYPKSVSMACANPIHGVVRECKFLPTPSEVIGWCERCAHPLHVESERERRIEKQFAAREEWQHEQGDRSMRLTYDELKQKYGDGKGGWLGEGGPRKTYSEEEKAAFLQDAKQVGASLQGMKLSDAALATLNRTNE